MRHAGKRCSECGMDATSVTEGKQGIGTPDGQQGRSVTIP